MRVVVPKSVLHENIGNYDRECGNALNLATKARRALAIVGLESHLGVVDAEVTGSDYHLILEHRLEHLGFDVVDIPEISHEEIVKRATRRIPPFDDKGGGYRDTLVWLTCLEEAREGRTVLLASRDAAFAGTDGELHPALDKETQDITGNVLLVREMGPMLAALSPWRGTERLEEAADLAIDEEVAFLLAPWDSFDEIVWNAEDLSLPRSAEILETHYKEDGGLERLDARTDDRGAQMIRYHMPVTFEATFHLPVSTAIESGLYPADEVEWAPVTVEATADVPMVAEILIGHDERAEEHLWVQDIEWTSQLELRPYVDVTPGQIPGQGLLPLVWEE